MLGVHAQVLSAAELSVGLRADGGGPARTYARPCGRRFHPTAPPPPSSPSLPSPPLPSPPRAGEDARPARDGAPAPPPATCRCGAPRCPQSRTARPPPPPTYASPRSRPAQVVEAIADALDGAFLTVDELGEEVVARTRPVGGRPGDAEPSRPCGPAGAEVLHRAGQCGALSFGPNRGRRVTYTRPPPTSPRCRPRGDAAPRTPIPVRVRARDPAALRCAGWPHRPAGRGPATPNSPPRSEIEEVPFEGRAAGVGGGR